MPSTHEVEAECFNLELNLHFLFPEYKWITPTNDSSCHLEHHLSTPIQV